MLKRTLPEANRELTPENRPFDPKDKSVVGSNHQFSDAFAASFREGIYVSKKQLNQPIVTIKKTHLWTLQLDQ